MSTVPLTVELDSKFGWEFLFFPSFYCCNVLFQILLNSCQIIAKSRIFFIGDTLVWFAYCSLRSGKFANCI